MLDTFRAASRTRCVEDHPDSVRVQHRKLIPLSSSWIMDS